MDRPSFYALKPRENFGVGQNAKCPGWSIVDGNVILVLNACTIISGNLILHLLK
jgi:hypothetical protein